MQMSHIYLCQGGYVFIGVCLFVCLSVSRIMQKLLDWISQNAVEKWQDIGRNGYISVVIQICQQLQFSAKYFEFPRSQSGNNSFLKFVDPDPAPDDFQNNLMVSSLSKDTSLIFIYWLAVFTARRYAYAQSLLWPGVCPSVCHVLCHAFYPVGWR